MLYLQIEAQDQNQKINVTLEDTTPLGLQLLNKISVNISASTSPFSTQQLGELSLKDLAKVNLGDLTIAYKMNNRLSYGISTMGSLSNSNSGYYNRENQLISFCEDDDDGDLEEEMEEHDDCDEDEIGQNLMGTITYKLSEKTPFYLQASGGYSFTGNAPAYAVLLGYNQQLFANFGMNAGLRFSDVLYKNPIGAIRKNSAYGLSLQLGLNWNF